ncbi:uncharacterized protein [Diabrotica undecimpunctata]|uniref:uncharacterized protein n=1 Tax=Diabrotica undecimpunctata TaxID=50387 RepID=UPI003B63C02E
MCRIIMGLFFCLIFICSQISATLTTTHPTVGVIEPHGIEHSIGVIEPHGIEHVKIHNKTEIPNEKPKNEDIQHRPEVKEADFEFNVDPSTEDSHKSTAEEISKLNIKCQHLYRLLFPNKAQPFQNKPSYDQYVDDNRPIYVTTPKPQVRPTYPSTMRPSSFYITVPTVNTRGPVQSTSPIKYIRLEPVILQKTILSNGRTVYYWHKSLPTAVEFSSRSIPGENLPNEETQQANYPSGYNNPFYGYYYNPHLYGSPNNGYYYPGAQNLPLDRRPVESTTEPSTTTSTTEESSYSYGLSNFIPFYGGSSAESTTTTTTEAPTTTPTQPNKASPEDLLYAQQLKFMVPVPYEERPVWNYNPYYYYQRGTQNPYRVPFSPSYQIVRAVTVPKSEEKINERIDDVST